MEPRRVGTVEPDDQLPSERTWGQAAPAPLLVAASLTFVQGLLVAVGAVAEALSITSDRVVLGLTTTVFFALSGGGLLLCAWGLQRTRPWARGPVLLAQLVWLGLAWSFRGVAPVSLALVVVAAIVLVGLLHPRSIEAIERARDEA